MRRADRNWRRDAESEGSCRRMSAGGGCGDAEFLEFGAGAALFFGAGITLHDFTKLFHAGGFLAEFELGHAFFQVGWSELKTLGVVGENTIVFLNGLIVVVLRIGDFSEIELRVRSEVGVAVILQ